MGGVEMARTTQRGKAQTLPLAAETTLTALREAGRLEKIDDLRVATIRGLVAALSAEPTNAALWRELRQAEAMLRTVEDDAGADDLTALFAALGDTPKP